MPPILGKPLVKRNKMFITILSLDDVAPNPEMLGVDVDKAWRVLGSCSQVFDRSRQARPGARYPDTRNGLTVEVTTVEPDILMSKWHTASRAAHCGYVIRYVRAPALYVKLDGQMVPRFNELKALVRRGNAVYAAIQYSGYASEIKGQGDRVFALDLCTHKVVW